MEMKKAVLKLDLRDDKDKKKAMRKVSGLSGVESISMDMKDKKMTVIGDIDTVVIVSKLRKLCHTEIITVGPAKEPEKKKVEPKEPEVKASFPTSYAYYPRLPPGYNDGRSPAEKGPSACACVIS